MGYVLILQGHLAETWSQSFFHTGDGGVSTGSCFNSSPSLHLGAVNPDVLRWIQRVTTLVCPCFSTLQPVGDARRACNDMGTT